MSESPLLVSYSDISSFLKCRRAWNWGFTEDWTKPDKAIGALAIGTRVHASIENYYLDNGDPVDWFDKLSEDAHSLLDSVDAPPWDYDTLEKETIIGRNCVEAHQEWLEEEGEDYNYNVFGVEQKVEADMLGGRIRLRGKADVVFQERDTGFLVVDDLKTTSAITPNLREELSKSWQHIIYLICLAETFPDQIVHRSTYTVMKKFTKAPKSGTPVVARWRVPGTSRNLSNKKVQLEAILTDMLRAYEEKSQYPSPQMGCSWCDYRHPCEVIDENPGSEVHILDREFVRGRKHARYTDPGS